MSRRRLARGPVLWLLLGYVVLFIAFMTFGEKKQDRYILPVYSAITMIAAVGLVELVRLVRDTARILEFVKKQLPAGVQPSPLRKQGTTAGCFSSTSRLKPVLRRGNLFFCGRFAPQILLAVVLVLHGVLVVTNYPYYFTYYNPLMGGIQGAERIVTIGWGEGLDLAADYLNQKPDAGQLRVAAWYQSTFAPFFKGEAISYAKEKGKALSGDYVVFYINQLQRRFPDDEMFRYFEERYQRETTIYLKGIPYAVIYPGPHIQHFVEDRVEEDRRSYRGIGALLGWDWTGADDPDCPSVTAGKALPFRLYWEYLGKLPEERFFFRLFGLGGQRVAEGISQPVLSDVEHGDPAAWRYGQIITEQGELSVPANSPPGNYRLEIGFYTKAPAVAEGELTFDLPAGEDCVRVVRDAE